MKISTLLGRVGLVIVASLLSIQMAQAAIFQIKGVAQSDSLNMRIKPGTKHAVVAKIPSNGKYIRTTGQRVSVGRTVWTKVTWQGKTGWVSERYIRPMQNPQAPQVVAPRATPPAGAPRAATGRNLPAPVARTAPVSGSKGKWVLECGNMSPFWRVIVHPKALDVNHRGQPAGMLPITYEKQDRNRWNTAMKTVLKSSNGQSQADMTIRYTKQCFHTLSKQNVHYQVKAMIRGEQMSGCCRAVRVQ